MNSEESLIPNSMLRIPKIAAERLNTVGALWGDMALTCEVEMVLRPASRLANLGSPSMEITVQKTCDDVGRHRYKCRLLPSVLRCFSCMYV
jgi:hypothetical protein